VRAGFVDPAFRLGGRRSQLDSPNGRSPVDVSSTPVPSIA